MNLKNVTPFFILAVLLIYPLPQLAIDIYLPSWPAMVHAFHSSATALQSSLSIYILFLGVAQLFYGSFSDRYGRRSTLFLGIFIFIVGSLGCLFSKTIIMFTVFRAIQGAGMGAGFVVASAILGDVFHGKQLAKMTSLSSVVYSLSAILAPVLGGYLQQKYGWHSNFIVMIGYALVLMMLIFFFIVETNDSKIQSLSFKKIVQDYGSLLMSAKFLGNVSCLALSYGVIVVFNLMAPFLLQNNLNISALTYGRCMFFIGCAYLLGTAINSYFLQKMKIQNLIFCGIFFNILGGVCLLIASFFNVLDVLSIILSSFIAIFGVGFIFPNSFAIALEVAPCRGVASAFIGSMTLLGTSLITIIVEKIHANCPFHLSLIYIALGLLALLTRFNFSKVKFE